MDPWELAISVLGSSVVATLVSSFVNRRRSSAEVRKANAEAKKARAEAEKASAEAERIRVDTRKRIEESTQRTDELTKEVGIQANQLVTLRLVLKHLLSCHEKFFLEQISEQSNYCFQDEYRDRDHLRRLADLGFVEKVISIGEIHRGQRLRDVVSITDSGREYLRLCRELESAASI